jgi:succinate-semialdehyde dehydrogenase/glutarate-semialdehyde dehydrogenase
LANSTEYGLGASVYSKERGEEVINRISSGMGFINSIVKSHALFPSGGVGKSGFGRECSVDGLRNFANIRTIYVN